LRARFSQEATRSVHRIEKVLEDAQIKLAARGEITHFP
jgi:hypothetical protein